MDFSSMLVVLKLRSLQKEETFLGLFTEDKTIKNMDKPKLGFIIDIFRLNLDFSAQMEKIAHVTKFQNYMISHRLQINLSLEFNASSN